MILKFQQCDLFYGMVWIVGVLMSYLIIKIEGNAEIVESVIVHTPLGGLGGMRIKTNYNINNTISDTYDVFRGVPYAQPPTNRRRFKPPQPKKPWKDIRNFRTHGPVCPQRYIWVDKKWPMKEDCLHLSIYSPYEAEAENMSYPVIVFIHGGSYEVGAERLYDGGVLSLYGVVTVFINYRLGILGFLASGDGRVNGNYGILDQIEALKWVQKYIKHFRGDPNLVTIMGQSVGSSSVGLLLTSPLAQGLFHRAIMQSGAVLARYSFQYNNTVNLTKHFIDVGRVHNCPIMSTTGPEILYEEFTDELYDQVNTESILRCLRNGHWRGLIYDRHLLPRNDPVIPEFRPIIDGNVLPEEPQYMLTRSISETDKNTDSNGASQVLSRVPILQGTVKDEMSPYTIWDKAVNLESTIDDWLIYHQVEPVKNSIFKYIEEIVGPDLVDMVRNKYSTWSENSGYTLELSKIIEDIDFVVPSIKLSNLISDIYPVYHYYFTATEISYHLVDLNYIFGAPFSGRNYDDNYSKFNYNDSDRRLSMDIMKLWCNFAKTGKAFIGETEYPRYSKVKKEYINIARNEITTKTDIKAQTMEFWESILPSLINKLNSHKTSQSNLIFSNEYSYSNCSHMTTGSNSETGNKHSDTGSANYEDEKMLIRNENLVIILILVSGVLSLLCISLILFIVCGNTRRKNELKSSQVLQNANSPAVNS